MLIPATSLEYVTIPITTTPAGVDLTGAAPQFAFLPDTNRANPTSGQWHTGEWDGSSTARILVGPDGGAATLTRGDWHVWIKIDPPNDELVVRRAGTLTIT